MHILIQSTSYSGIVFPNLLLLFRITVETAVRENQKRDAERESVRVREARVVGVGVIDLLIFQLLVY